MHNLFFRSCTTFLVLIISTITNAQVSANYSKSSAFGCVNSPVTCTDLSTGPVINWLWDFGDGETSTLQSPSHTYSQTGTYTITLTVDNGLGDTDVFTSNYIVRSPTANFSLSPSTGCTVPRTIFFTDTSILPDTWAWDFGDGGTSTAQNPIRSYTTAGAFEVTLTVSDTINGCVDSFKDSVKIAVLNSDFTATTTFGCGPRTVGFTNTSVNSGYGSIVSYNWNFGDGTTSTAVNPTHVYNDPGTYTVVLTTTNSLGCTNTMTKTNYIQIIGPNIEFSGDVLSGTCGPLNVNFTNNTISSAPAISYLWDFGDGSTSNSINPAHSYTTNGTFDVSLTVSDLDGCTRTLTKANYISLSDVTPPVFTVCPANQDVDFSATCDFDLVDYITLATATDDCSTPTITQSPVAGTTILTTTTVILTATDVAGNTTSCAFDVIPTDNIPPTIACPANQTVDFSATCDYTLVDFTSLASVTDNCGSFTVSQSPAIGTVITTDQTITFTSEDDNGNISGCTFDVIPIDVSAPSIICPANQNVDFSATCDYILLDYTGLATTTDNCGGVSVTQTPVVLIPITGSTPITLTATDGAGNSTDCTFDIIPSDVTPPIINCPTDITQDADIGLCTSIVAYSTPVGTDNCSGSTTTLIAGLPSASPFSLGSTVVTYEVIDDVGLSSTCSFTITVVDTEVPMIDCPSAITQNNDLGMCGAIVAYSPPIFSDNCTGEILTQTAGLATSAFFPIGTTTNTFEVIDAAGNLNSCTFDVTIIDNELPTITCADSVSTCDSLIVVNDPITTDNCTGELFVLTSGIASGSIFPVGETINTYQVTDGGGNTATCNTVITRFIIPSVNVGDDLLISAGKSVEIDATTNNAALFSWSPTDGLSDPTIENPIATPNQSTSYTLTVTSAEGCQNFDEMKITVSLQIEVNNFLSPNGDGKNDTWIIKGHYLLDDCTIQIFDSWGNNVFKSVGYNNDWGGHELNGGVYYYVISCEGDKPITGSITLIK